MAKPFQHQAYDLEIKLEQYEIVAPTELVSPDSPKFNATMESAGNRFLKSGVTSIVLVHGTMVGTDALGWYGHWQRVLPNLSVRLKNTYKRAVDSFSGDKGNYTDEFASLLESSLDPAKRISVDLFRWSSENHHLGRADAAVRLTEMILKHHANDERVLLWGHSHAGNVFALVSNLLVGDSKERRKFFDSTAHFSDRSGRISVPSWLWLKENIDKQPKTKLDFVTFGTPIRYGWNPDGYQNLLHFINHRMSDDAPVGRGKFASNAGEVVELIKGEHGDFVQQTFVAGTDFPPAIWSWPAWKANQNLRKLVEFGLVGESRLARQQHALRVANQGKAILVDYLLQDETATDLAGHSIYTEIDWMAFHCSKIADELY